MLHRVVVATAGVPNAHHDVMDADCLREAATERGDFEFDESTQQLIAYVEDGSDIPVATVLADRDAVCQRKAEEQAKDKCPAQPQQH